MLFLDRVIMGWDGMRDLVGLDIIVDTGENMVIGDGISWTGGQEEMRVNGICGLIESMSVWWRIWA